ncbi:MAG: hypothetical protein D6785_10085 [Planctomycetota bacterium]|nr:MAG: hypothetical protein D6785_10085 [Planctomycetota bacterium]
MSTKKEGEGQKELVIHVLMEHQSRPIPKIRYRFQKSQMGIWSIFEERQRVKKKVDRLPFPPILPLLINTGKENWQVPSLNEYFGFPKEYAPFTPEVEILFLGLYTERGKEFIQTRKFLALSFDLLRHEDWETSQFQQVLENVIKDLEKILKWELQFIIRLIYHRRPIEERDLLVEFIMEKLPEEIEEEVISMKKSYADILYEEGMQKGMQQGMQEGRQEGLIQSKQEDILRVLEKRFGSVSDTINQKVGSTQDLSRLEELLDLSVTCQSLEEFEAGL